jgi:iron complex transport system ATP-binding protein
VTLLAAEALTVGYTAHRRQQPVIRDIAAGLRPGELVGLIGPNGAGKSTLMRTLAGMAPPLAGRVLLRGRDVRSWSARRLATELAVVLTERVTAGLLTAEALVGLGRSPYTGWSGRLTAADREIVWRCLAAVDACELADRSLAELSDGERQKVMIARALAQEPAVLLLDEVTAFLDLPRRVEVVRILRDLAHREGKAILLSTHDLELALRSADLLWLLPKGGPLLQGLPEELVLAGAFDITFTSEGVAFDPATGSFQFHQRTVAGVEVAGEGLLATWTGRALERLGYRLERPGRGAALRVEVPAAAGAAWRLREDGRSADHATLGDLVAALRSAPEAP